VNPDTEFTSLKREPLTLFSVGAVKRKPAWKANRPTVQASETQFAALLVQVPPGELVEVLEDLKKIAKEA